EHWSSPPHVAQLLSFLSPFRLSRSGRFSVGATQRLARGRLNGEVHAPTSRSAPPARFLGRGSRNRRAAVRVGGAAGGCRIGEAAAAHGAPEARPGGGNAGGPGRAAHAGGRNGAGSGIRPWRGRPAPGEQRSDERRGGARDPAAPSRTLAGEGGGGVRAAERRMGRPNHGHARGPRATTSARGRARRRDADGG